MHIRTYQRAFIEGPLLSPLTPESLIPAYNLYLIYSGAFVKESQLRVTNVFHALIFKLFGWAEISSLVCYFKGHAQYFSYRFYFATKPEAVPKS